MRMEMAFRKRSWILNAFKCIWILFILNPGLLVAGLDLGKILLDILLNWSIPQEFEFFNRYKSQ